MEPQAARIGTRVKVVDCRRREFRGMGGKIVRRYGAPEYLALDVRLEDGRSELFWCRELEQEPVLEPPGWRLLRLWRRWTGRDSDRGGSTAASARDQNLQGARTVHALDPVQLDVRGRRRA